MDKSKKRLILLLMLLSALIFTGCTPSKGDVLENMVSKEEGKYTIHLFSADDDWILEVITVFNSEPNLLKNVENITGQVGDEKLKWLSVLGLEEKRTQILIFDTKELVYHTDDPENLREFAKTLEE